MIGIADMMTREPKGGLVPGVTAFVFCVAEPKGMRSPCVSCIVIPNVLQL